MPAPDQTIKRNEQHRKALAMIDIAGGTVIGFNRHQDRLLIYFNDPQTGSTLAMPLTEIVNVEAVQTHIAASRAKFNPTKEVAK
jgi:hypothetical protein